MNSVCLNAPNLLSTSSSREMLLLLWRGDSSLENVHRMQLPSTSCDGGNSGEFRRKERSPGLHGSSTKSRNDVHVGKFIGEEKADRLIPFPLRRRLSSGIGSIPLIGTRFWTHRPYSREVISGDLARRKLSRCEAQCRRGMEIIKGFLVGGSSRLEYRCRR